MSSAAVHGPSKVDDADLVRLLTRRDLPAAFERRHVVLPPGVERAADAAEWAGALVVVEQGRLEVDCRRAGRRVFVPGDLLALGWLPIEGLHNPGRVAVRLVVVHRWGDAASEDLLRVVRVGPRSLRRRPPS